MKVAIAIDSFKGSLSSLQAGNAAAQGIHRVDPDVKTVVRTLADGGEGTVQALTEGLGGQFVSVPVTGPAQKTVSCTYGVIEQAQTAVIEMSGAAGITLVSDTERNPLYTTTYGVGEVIQDAVLRGCRHFIIGIGGSATNDGGIGMLQALGFGLLDAEGKQVPFGAVGLESLTAITTDHVLPELSECTFRIACDVTNPLCGSNGCVWTHRLPPTPRSARKHSRTSMRNFPERVLRADLDLLFRRFFLLRWNPAFRSYWTKPGFVMM